MAHFNINKHSLVVNIFWERSGAFLGHRCSQSLKSFIFSEMLSNPKLVPVQGTLNVVMKQNVTLSCLSQAGSPPVRYTLFKHNQQVSALNSSESTPALFTLTISSASDVGEYKCKAEHNNSSGGKYSNSLTFTLIGTSCCAPPQLWVLQGHTALSFLD